MKIKKLLMKYGLVSLAIVSMVFSSTIVANADEDDYVRPTKVTKIVAPTKTITVGTEFELRAKISPTYADDDYLRWKIVGKKGIIQFDDNDRTDDEAEFVARKAGTTKVRCSIAGKSKKYSKTITIKVKKKTSKAKIYRVGSATKKVGVYDDIELKVRESKNISDRYLKWTIKNKSILSFDEGERYGDDVELQALKTGKTTVTCKNTLTGQTVKYTVQVVNYEVDDDDDDD